MSTPPGFFGQRAVDALGLACSQAAWVTCCDGGHDVQAVGERLGCRVLSLERRAPRGQYSFREVAAAARLLLLTDDLPHARHAFAYSAAAGLERVSEARGTRLLGPTAALKAQVDFKPDTREAFRRLGLPVLPSLTSTIEALDFDDAASAVGVPFVVQPVVGSSGRGTMTVRSRDDLNVALSSLPCRDTPMMVTGWGGSASLNIHGVVDGRRRVHVSPPSVQTIGIAELGAAANEYCGNDWSAAAVYPDTVRSAISAQTVAIGGWLHAIGYIGAFGVDFAVSGDRVSPLEVNPRFQGSTWALVGVEEAADLPLTSAAHKSALNSEAIQHSRVAPSLARGAQLILHADAPGGVVVSTPRHGRHRLERDSLRHLGPGLLPADCSEGDVLVGGMPERGKRVEAGAVIARLFSWRRLASPDGRGLTPLGHRLASRVNAAIELDYQDEQQEQADARTRATHG